MRRTSQTFVLKSLAQVRKFYCKLFFELKPSRTRSNCHPPPPSYHSVVLMYSCALRAHCPVFAFALHRRLCLEILTALAQTTAETPFQGGCFKMKLVFGPDFPSAPPKGFFITPIFHPNVAKNGEICVNTLKKDWKADCKLSHILMVVRCLLIEPNPESALNEEAGRMFMEVPSLFRIFKQSITRCCP